MRVLVTRPRAEAEPFAKRLQALGHTTLVEPLIDIAFRDGPALDLTDIQAIAFTSANGVRAAARRTSNRSIGILAVGPATAAEARALGFATVSESSGEGIDGLAAHIRATANPGAGAILHATGTVTAGDLRTALPNFTIRTAQLYDAHAAEALSGALVAEVEAGLIGAATFFSPRTAALFATLAQSANIGADCRNIAALCLSTAVANALMPLTFRAVRVAEKPTADAMLHLLAP